ncbi:S8 family serine peptidase [Nocardioides sp. GXQ0305]|uniref:S8 family serine peptidase n=1 Tax=Nocardioides sp. GXQ0305 TaxID=3423912 RepID=UPI003D7DCF88
MVRRARVSGRAVIGAALLGLAVGTLAPASAVDARAAAATRLYVVTFDDAGTASDGGPADVARHRRALRREQDEALAGVGAGVPTYRWTTALSGVAVDLTASQAAELQARPEVTQVEANTVRPLAARPRATPGAVVPGGQGGRGVVVGVVDSGVWPESPLFAAAPGTGRRTGGFRAACVPGEGWDADTCNAKLVGARWFVEGFGRDRLSAAEALSARDVRGHGTQVASIAVGNAGVSTGVAGLPGRYAGAAPDARLAVYKACWTAPDPADDGCATADLVTAIDQAVGDGVDVLNLSVRGAPETGGVERALLGAAEAGVVVVAAAGNDASAYAAPSEPWVTTVGALAGTGGAGSVALPDGLRLRGAMTVRREVRGPVVLGADVPAPGWTEDQARACEPGSLDAARTADAIVLCERGDNGRLEKSAAVARADGVGMILVNVARGTVAHDLHAVPTVHLGREAGRTIARWAADHPDADVRLSPAASRLGPLRVPGWSAVGDPAGSFVKPDLVVPATGILAATPPRAVGGGRWSTLDGTSAAAARTAGDAAVLLARHDWPADAVRSVLATSAAPVRGGALRTGSGRSRVDEALRTRLALVTGPGDYRDWLQGDRSDLNTPSVLIRGERTSATRTVTNLGSRARYWSVRVSGFERHDVRVTPVALRLDPGETAELTVTVGRGPLAGGIDDGAVTWRSPAGVRTRIPVVIAR